MLCSKMQPGDEVTEWVRAGGAGENGKGSSRSVYELLQKRTTFQTNAYHIQSWTGTNAVHALGDTISTDTWWLCTLFQEKYY